MNTDYLFPNKYKKIGCYLLVPSAIISFLTLFFEYEPDVLTLKVLSFFKHDFFDGTSIVGVIENNVMDEVFGILLLISLILVAFSKEKIEDEYISKIRLESLVWAVYVNYGILLISFIFIFGMSFLWVMIFNMFTVLLFFIVRFNWQISKLQKPESHEE